jgi:acyl-CoA thioester hydrolase
MTFTALAEHIDENGHVNNTVWVRWMEDYGHRALAARRRPGARRHLCLVVTRHEIDYRGNIGLGDSVEGVTEIREDRAARGSTATSPSPKPAAKAVVRSQDHLGDDRARQTGG